MNTNKKRAILQAFQDVLQNLNNLHDHVATYETEQYIHLEDLIREFETDDRVKQLFNINISKAPIDLIEELATWLNIFDNEG